mmetsp:Transcript_44814/g.70179  ORF Transcript_44814/g.70179 Transcript_44814/m.70179 type:complete len:136 (-) Transcript_44814:153-560(-)
MFSSGVGWGREFTDRLLPILLLVRAVEAVPAVLQVRVEWLARNEPDDGNLLLCVKDEVLVGVEAVPGADGARARVADVLGRTALGLGWSDACVALAGRGWLVEPKKLAVTPSSTLDGDPLACSLGLAVWRRGGEE